MTQLEIAIRKIETSAYTGVSADLSVEEAEALVLHIRKLENLVSAARIMAEAIASGN